MPSPTPSSARPLTRLRHVLSLVVAVVLGLAILSAKLGAPRAAPPPAPPASGKPAASAAPAAAPAQPSPSAAPSAAPSASPSASPPPDGSAKPIDYAVVQTDEDFDKNLSDEQKDAIGTGKVPIHREGPYKSPFAHPRFGGPAKVKVGLVLSQVRDYSIQTGIFDADFFLSLTSVDKEMPDLSPFFANGKEVDQQVLADTPTFKLYRVHGTFSSNVDLRLYPFDTQRLTIEFEDLKAGVDQIVLEADGNRTSLDEGFNVPGWGVGYLGAKAYKHRYPARFDRDDLQMSRYAFEIGLDRFGLAAALSVFVPAIVIVLISLTGMWVPPQELEVRSNTGAPMLAAAVLFHYALLATLPATGYLTRADKVMMGTYIALLLNMFSTWTFLIVDEERREPLFRFWRVAAPALTVVVMALAFSI